MNYLGKMESIEIEIVYRGSDDGWLEDDFHRCADNKGATITLFKIEYGDCIGGYTTQSWHSRGSSWEDGRVQDD